MPFPDHVHIMQPALQLDAPGRCAQCCGSRAFLQRITCRRALRLAHGWGRSSSERLGPLCQATDSDEAEPSSPAANRLSTIIRCTTVRRVQTRTMLLSH